MVEAVNYTIKTREEISRPAATSKFDQCTNQDEVQGVTVLIKYYTELGLLLTNWTYHMAQRFITPSVIIEEIPW